jgi:hypothetical protein
MTTVLYVILCTLTALIIAGTLSNILELTHSLKNQGE